jgi:hypothetical protein
LVSTSGAAIVVVLGLAALSCATPPAPPQVGEPRPAPQTETIRGFEYGFYDSDAAASKVPPSSSVQTRDTDAGRARRSDEERAERFEERALKNCANFPAGQRCIAEAKKQPIPGRIDSLALCEETCWRERDRIEQVKKRALEECVDRQDKTDFAEAASCRLGDAGIPQDYQEPCDRECARRVESLRMRRFAPKAPGERIQLKNP